MRTRDKKKICSDPTIDLTRKSPIHERPLLTPDQSVEIVALFKVLANDSRLRLLHALVRVEDLCVGELAELLEMTPQAVSNQLRRLVDRRIVAARRDGNRIRYRIVDSCVPGLLGLGLCLAEETGRLVSTKAKPLDRSPISSQAWPSPIIQAKKLRKSN